MFKEVGQSVPNKRHELKQLLKERIESGFYRPGERLPSGHELAVELNSSYVTVVKALKLLADEGYVNCRQGVGNFVSRQSAADTGNRRLVNLICPDPVNSQYREEMAHFVVVGSEVFQDAGWEVRPCPIEGDFSNARQAISDPEAYSVITGFRPYWKNFAVSIEHVRNRVVLIGERSEHDGIACITADETQSIRVAMDHLHAQGCGRIALICANMHSQLEMQRVIIWRSLSLEYGLDFDWCRNFCLDLRLPDMAPVEEYVNQLVHELDAAGSLARIDGIIIPDDYVAALVIGALQDRGLRVPEDVGVVSIGNTPLARTFRPQITSIDVDQRQHFVTAVEILEQRIRGHRDELLFHICQPKLKIRTSSMRFHPEAASVPVGI